MNKDGKGDSVFTNIDSVLTDKIIGRTKTNSETHPDTRNFDTAAQVAQSSEKKRRFRDGHRKIIITSLIFLLLVVMIISGLKRKS